MAARLINTTAFEADASVLTSATGESVWCVVMKGTWRVAGDQRIFRVAGRIPIQKKPLFKGEPHESMMLSDSDLQLQKPGTDVLVNGAAWAPKGQTATSVDVSLLVNGRIKTLRVHGERIWKSGFSGPKPSSAAPFVSMPVCWTRAFGGRDEITGQVDRRNPIGTGFTSDPTSLLGLPVPGVEHIDAPITSAATSMPAGFGNVPSYWTPRSTLAGTFDERWKTKRAPLAPDDFDARFYQAAPSDQQFAGHLRGGEAVILSNMTEDGILRFTLPQERFVFKTEIAGREVTHRARMQTVLIEPGQKQFTVTWQTQIPCHDQEDRIQATRILRKRLVSKRGRQS